MRTDFEAELWPTTEYLFWGEGGGGAEGKISAMSQLQKSLVHKKCSL